MQLWHARFRGGVIDRRTGTRARARYRIASVETVAVVSKHNCEPDTDYRIAKHSRALGGSFGYFQ